jgi:hypothetical protein
LNQRLKKAGTLSVFRRFPAFFLQFSSGKLIQIVEVSTLSTDLSTGIPGFSHFFPQNRQLSQAKRKNSPPAKSKIVENFSTDFTRRIPAEKYTNCQFFRDTNDGGNAYNRRKGGGRE